MPTYQYACTECGHAFEQHQDFSDDTLTVCPECAGRLRKVYNAVGVVFKGSGFYRNDSRKASATDSSSESTSTSTTEKSSTPEKKAESTGTKTEKKSTPSTGKTSAGSTSAA